MLFMVLFSTTAFACSDRTSLINEFLSKGFHLEMIFELDASSKIIVFRRNRRVLIAIRNERACVLSDNLKLLIPKRQDI